MEINMVEMWLKKDPKRWGAGFLAGLFSGLVMAVFAMFVVRLGGGEDIWFPIKLAAVPFLGSGATEFDSGMRAIGVGLAVHEVLCGVLGALYAHFTVKNHWGVLLGVGFTWGAFSWIFINNLFTPSFDGVLWAGTPTVASLVIHLVFGFALSSVAFFDRMVRGGA